jgi:hypothetical protein
MASTAIDTIDERKGSAFFNWHDSPAAIISTTRTDPVGKGDLPAL